jgi:hypothetical protein
VFSARKPALVDSTRAPGVVCSPLTRQYSFRFARVGMAGIEDKQTRHHLPPTTSAALLSMAAPMAFSLKMLFGGAITAYMPEGLLDVSCVSVSSLRCTADHPPSDLRQVPDTQEVYLDPLSNVSLILEILVRVEPNALKDAAVWAGTSIGADLN